jgi:propionyl-CoA carboxylase alpha chain/3-methylcrotonyl-CoA carboxylase alpha subunit
MMFNSVLVANRGEIARRVFRTARRMGLRTIAVYSEADAGAPHVRDADEAVLIGPAAAKDSYLDAGKVLAAAKQTGAEAIHPGYGFLSENAEFAEAVAAAGINWIGPPPAAIRAMGLKDAAKTLMHEAGVPVTPGYLGEDQSEERLAKEAGKIGYPVLIKAVAGGGGKGMRRVDKAADFAAALASARREAAAAFGDERVLLETYVTRPRHIEVQVFGDTKGQVVHLFERDCSLQRRHQKVIEEAPAPGMDAATRAAVCDAAVRAAKAVDYVGAGTVEFIADASEGLRPDRIWFMEMNTRLQVEHPVTEAVTGVDLVEWQLRVAAGQPLPLRQDQLTLTGCAIEARLYAENPAKKFLPSTGPLRRLRLPEGIRVDAGVEEGGSVSHFYDPMIAKLIAAAPTRTEAVARLAEAVRQVEVWPVKTNAGFLVRCLEHPDFVAGAVDTSFIDQRLEALTPQPTADEPALRRAAATLVDGQAPAPGFRLNAASFLRVRLEADGEPVDVTLTQADLGMAPTWRDGEDLIVFSGGEAVALGLAKAQQGSVDAVHGGEVRAPMPGRIVAVSAANGDTLAKGAPIAVMEAMKMEYALTAPVTGVLEGLGAKVGDQVEEGAVLARVVAAS